MKISYSKRFIKHLKKSPKNIKLSFRKRLAFFIENKNDKILNNHALRGKWKKYKSINITGDWRAIYYECESGEVEWIEFVEIGKHSKLYK